MQALRGGGDPRFGGGRTHTAAHRVAALTLAALSTTVLADPYAPPGVPLDPNTMALDRDARGRIVRSSSAVRAFRRANACPATGAPSRTCPGYVVDHIRALKRGGADLPYNLQFQSVAAARRKDLTE